MAEADYRNAARGNSRIVMRVTKDDRATLESLDAKGKVVFRAPEEG
jgi:hypothetical protein